MSRTPRGEVRFYHLEIGKRATTENISLLLGDRAGEEYRELADDPSRAVSLAELARADSLTVLVDGERLLDAGARHNLHSEIILMLQGLRAGAGAWRLPPGIISGNESDCGCNAKTFQYGLTRSATVTVVHFPAGAIGIWRHR